MFQTLTLPAGERFSTVRFPNPRRPMDSGIRRGVTISALSSTAEARRPASLYEVLQVKETASQVEIKIAYRSLAKRFHPDAVSQGSDGRDFIRIREAYSTLSDPTARERYDLSIGRLRFTADVRSDQVFRPRRWETDQCW